MSGEQVKIHVCGGKQEDCPNSSDGKHDWSGPEWVSGNGLEVSSTCKDCGMPFIQWAMWNLP